MHVYVLQFSLIFFQIMSGSSGTKRSLLRDEMQALLHQRDEITKKICFVANETLQEAVEEKLSTFQFDQHTLDQVRAELDRQLSDEAILTLDDEDAIYDIWKPMHVEPVLFIEQICIEGRMKECKLEHCYYDNNPDRMDEWTHSNYNAADPKHFVYCNVCVNDLDDDVVRDILAAERRELFPILYMQLKN
jgi:hypothetical protein